MISAQSQTGSKLVTRQTIDLLIDLEQEQSWEEVLGFKSKTFLLRGNSANTVPPLEEST